MKALDIITSALQEIGEYSPSDLITDADAELGLNVLNDMLDSWANQNLALYATLTQTFQLVINQTRYSIGPFPSCDIVGTRPLRVVQCYLTDTMNNNYPIQIVEFYEWNQITNKVIDGQVPSVLWYDSQDPIGYLNFWPSPVLVWNVSIVSYLQLAAFGDLYQDVVMPRGYVPALKANLAVNISPYFGLNPPQVTVRNAAQWLGDVKRMNYRFMPAYYDAALVNRGLGAYDIFSDTMSGVRGSFPM